MIMALATADCQAKENRAGCVDAIDNRLNAELFWIDAAFLIFLCITMETGSDALFSRCIRQQIAGQLLDDELIERLVLVQGVDDPIAVFPDGARRIDAVAVGVGVARQVEPMAAPPFAVVWAGQQPLDDALVGIGPFITQEIFYVLWRRRQTDEVEVNTAQQGDALGFRRGSEALFFQPREDESIHGIATPVAIFDMGQYRPPDRLKGPVRAGRTIGLLCR